MFLYFCGIVWGLITAPCYWLARRKQRSFRLQRQSRHVLIYRERDREVTVYIDAGWMNGRGCVLVESGSIRSTDSSHLPIDVEFQQRVLKNVKKWYHEVERMLVIIR